MYVRVYEFKIASEEGKLFWRLNMLYFAADHKVEHKTNPIWRWLIAGRQNYKT